MITKPKMEANQSGSSISRSLHLQVQTISPILLLPGVAVAPCFRGFLKILWGPSPFEQRSLAYKVGRIAGLVGHISE